MARHRVSLRLAVATSMLSALSALGASTAEASPSFTAFESGEVRPLALSPNKKLLFSVNTPDNRVEVYRVQGDGLSPLASIPVGLEPVAVAARTNDEVWVVNHLSDSVSVVKLVEDGKRGYVARTLQVGDEPRDIVFAGPGRKRAFITAAHRGQNNPVNPQLTTAGVGRADVWVFDATQLGDGSSDGGGDPLSILTLFADTPRALAVSPDGDHVYAAAFHSGNRTTTLNVSLFFPFSPIFKPAPFTNADGFPAPPSGLIVQFDGQHWIDEEGSAYDDLVRFSLPDKDVFVIDASATPPAATGSFSGVGTVLYNMAVNPVSGKVYVSNTEALNVNRFDGPGVFAGHSLRGHFAENRVTVLGSNGVSPRHLNKHIDYDAAPAPPPNAESELSLALPTGMAVSDDGKRLYVAALGSGKVGIYDTAALEADTFVPSHAAQIELTGGGPTGLVLDDKKNRLYVRTRFDNGISVINTKLRAEIGHVTMFSPEPASVSHGRKVLYDARNGSGHGDSACATCHVFGDTDSLAWDLGNPDGSIKNNPGPFLTGITDPISQAPFDPSFHPMKGPMSTQSLRGLDNHGPMHWRGDRNGGFTGDPSLQPNGGGFDERAAFLQFQGTFIDLLGRGAPLPAADMEAFADFMLQVTYPPNPIRNLDGSLTADQEEGKALFFQRKFDGDTCQACHALDPKANPSAARPGFFGTSGGAVFEGLPQMFKVPHLRNLYQKVGMFGLPELPIAVPGDNDFTGDQIRGFGFAHDGSADTLVRFERSIIFSQILNPEGFPLDPSGDGMRRKIESFLLAFDTNHAPIVGQQVTLTKHSQADANARADLLISMAEQGSCDLVARLASPSVSRGFAHVGSGMFLSDRAAEPPIKAGDLRALVHQGNRALTFTCAPVGSGIRAGIDRDEDGVLDGDEAGACD